MKLFFVPVAAFVATGVLVVPAGAFTPQGVRLKVSVPPVVEVHPGKAEVPVTLTLSNSAVADAELRVMNPCSVRQWVVQDARAVSVGQAEVCTRDADPQSRVVAGGESVVESLTVPVRPQMLRENETYVLQYRFWDIPVTAKFKIKLVK